LIEVAHPLVLGKSPSVKKLDCRPTNQLLVANISHQAVMKLIAHGVPFFVFPISLSYA